MLTHPTVDQLIRLGLAGMARAFTDDVPVISLIFPGIPYASSSAVRGLMPVAPEGLISWNVHEWDLIPKI